MILAAIRRHRRVFELGSRLDRRPCPSRRRLQRASASASRTGRSAPRRTSTALERDGTPAEPAPAVPLRYEVRVRRAETGQRYADTGLGVLEHVNGRTRPVVIIIGAIQSSVERYAETVAPGPGAPLASVTVPAIRASKGCATVVSRANSVGSTTADPEPTKSRTPIPHIACGSRAVDHSDVGDDEAAFNRHCHRARAVLVGDRRLDRYAAIAAIGVAPVTPPSQKAIVAFGVEPIPVRVTASPFTSPVSGSTSSVRDPAPGVNRIVVLAFSFGKTLISGVAVEAAKLTVPLPFPAGGVTMASIDHDRPAASVPRVQRIAWGDAMTLHATLDGSRTRWNGDGPVERSLEQRDEVIGMSSPALITPPSTRNRTCEAIGFGGETIRAYISAVGSSTSMATVDVSLAWSGSARPASVRGRNHRARRRRRRRFTS